MTNTPLIEWPQPLFELLEFLGALLAIGAVGFRFGVFSRVGAGVTDAARALAGVDRRAATIGFAGAALVAWHLVRVLPGAAARRHLDVVPFLQQTPPAALWAGGTALAVVGFALAFHRPSPGWALAGLGVMAGALRNLASGQWERMLKPLHVLAAGLWVGTLFVLVAAGIAGVLASALPRDRRGMLVARMVHAFTPLALGSAGLLAVLGAWLSWRELGEISKLWTTPYGVALAVKVALAGGVVALGAVNWKRQAPRLGSEESARSLLGTASAELVVALLVVMATAVLVSLPAPR